MSALVRPEAVELVAEAGSQAHVAAVSFLGSVSRVQVSLPDGVLVVAQMAASDATGIVPGAAVRVSVRPAPVFAVAT